MMDIDLQKFCGVNEGRTYLNAPFSAGKFSYATDGISVVRVPRRHDIPEVAEATKAVATLDKALAPLEGAVFESVRDIVLPDAEEKSRKIECNSCDGSGLEHDCPSCECKCDNCAGTGRESITDKISVSAFGKMWRLPYLRRILALPGIEIMKETGANAEGIAPFRFDGGVAGLLPCRRRYERHFKNGTEVVA